MSLILPGAGQYYNKSPFWKTASFLGVELGSILAWRYYQNKAEELRDDYQAFADMNWSMENWVYNRFNTHHPHRMALPGPISCIKEFDRNP